MKILHQCPQFLIANFRFLWQKNKDYMTEWMSLILSSSTGHSALGFPLMTANPCLDGGWLSQHYLLRTKDLMGTREGRFRLAFWMRRMTLLHLLESFSWHHLRKGGGYSHQRRAENCIHLFEKLGVKLKQLIIPRHKSRKPYELKVGKFSTDICATYRCFRADARKGFVTWSTVPERYCQKPLSFHFALWWFENVEVAYLFPVWNHLRWAYTPWFCSLVMLLYCIRYYISAQTPVNC